MDIRTLTMEDMGQAKALWDAAFGDSPAYRDWYFANRIQEGYSLGAFEGEQMASMLHMLPFELDWYGRPLAAACIAGVATWPGQRKKGLANALLKACFEQLKARGTPLAFLYPFRQSFYRPSGFATVSDMDKITFSAGSLSAIDAQGYRLLDHAQTPNLNGVREVYREMTANYTGYALRDERAWRLRTQEWAVDGGSLLWLEKNGACRGYALWARDGEKGVVEEWGARDLADFGALCRLLLERCGGTGSLEMLAPPETPVFECLPERKDVRVERIPYAMMRILDVPQVVLPAIAKKTQDEVLLELDDGIIAENAGKWIISCKMGMAHRQYDARNCALKMTVGQLIQTLTHYGRAAEQTRWGVFPGEKLNFSADKPILLWDKY